MEEAYSRALYVAMCVSFCLPHPIAMSVFIICSGLCACNEMQRMCVLYVSVGSKARPRTFGCVAMGSAVWFILRFRLLLYSADYSYIQMVLVYVFLGCTRAGVCRCDGNGICVCHDLNRYNGWW